MFGINLTSNQMFILGVASLWVFSAAVGSMPLPTAQSSPFYCWAYKFLKIISGDLGSVFGKYIPPAATTALIALLCVMLTIAPIGCTQQQKINAAQEIVNWGPQIESTVDVVLATLPVFDPPMALAVAPLTVGWDDLAKAIISASNDYLANPNQTTLAFLQMEIVKFQQSVNSAVLVAAGIKNSASQKLALAVLNGVAVVANAVLGLVQSISSKTQLAAMAKNIHITLAMVRPYLDQNRMQMTAARISHDLQLSQTPTVNQFFATEASYGF